MRHVEELEQQLAGTMEQLAAMRQDLQEMQKSPLKSALQKTVHALEEKAEALRGQIAALKENIIEGCKPRRAPSSLTIGPSKRLRLCRRNTMKPEST